MALKSFRPGDLWGGLSASALVLPQAMAFGIALWAPYTSDPAAAALSGLIAASCLCIASGFAFGTQGLVSAPTGPTLVLLAGAIAALNAAGLSGEALVTATLLTVALGGLLQALIGAFKLGHLIKYMPYPVVSGFMTGTAILMIMSQGRNLTGNGEGGWLHGGWIPAATAAVTIAAMIWLPRYIKRLPGTALGLIAGTVAFHLFGLFLPGGIPQSWIVGNLPPITDIRVGIDLSLLPQLPWPLIFVSALALAVLASLDTLLTSVVADVSTGARHHSRRELMGQGIGHMLSSMLGGMAGAGTTGATLVAVNSGGRYWAGVVTGVTFLLLILFMGPVAAVLPISVFAGIILHVAVFSMLDKDIVLWMRTPRARLDGLIALIVIAVTILYDLMVAVGLGVALAVIEFIRSQVQTAVVNRRRTIGEHTSLRRRPNPEFELLSQHAELVVTYELKGILFFGTTDHLLETMSEDLKRARYIVLDMQRVSQVDLTAIRLIEHMSGILRSRGGELILANVPASMGLVKQKGHRHERVVPYHDNQRLRTFSDGDRALEYAEDCLLRDLGQPGAMAGYTVGLGESGLLAGFDVEARTKLEGYFDRVDVAAGDYLFHSGDEGSELFVILRGQVEVLLPYQEGETMRLAKFGPGMCVGEVRFLEPGPRTADARATEDCELGVLRHEVFRQLCRDHAELGLQLLLGLAHELSHNLRRADKKLRQLAS